MENIRELAVDSLLEIVENERYTHLVIREVQNKYNYIEERDKAFYKRLTEGTLERMVQIDYILNQFSRVPVSKMKPFIRNLLRISVYQMLFMDTVPDSAVCNEAVNLACKRGFKTLRGFVNGVLRNIARKKQKIVYPDKEREPLLYLSVKYSMPLWLVEKFVSERGWENTEKMLESFLVPSPVTIRVKESLTEIEKADFLENLKKAGVSVSQHPYLPYAYCLKGVEGVQNLPGFKEGLFMVQDVSSMLVCEAADIHPGDRIIDVCAAPGGKAVHAAEKAGDTGFVSARDITEYKVGLIRDNSNRMQVNTVDAMVWNACDLRVEDVARTDVCLADLPCSGLGIIGKKQDIKYNVSKEGLTRLKELQREILSEVCLYVKPYGVLIYSTCTVNAQENEENVKWFLKHFPFELESLSPYLPECLKEEGSSGMLQLLPGVHETDGFFMARFRRNDRKRVFQRSE